MVLKLAKAQRLHEWGNADAKASTKAFLETVPTTDGVVRGSAPRLLPFLPWQVSARQHTRTALFHFHFKLVHVGADLSAYRRMNSLHHCSIDL